MKEQVQHKMMQLTSLETINLKKISIPDVHTRFVPNHVSAKVVTVSFPKIAIIYSVRANRPINH